MNKDVAAACLVPAEHSIRNSLEMAEFSSKQSEMGGMRYCIVGAGFSGAVIGRALAQAG
jgi:hypothetical protein